MSVTSLHSSLPGNSHPPSRLTEYNSTCSDAFESSPSVNQPSSIYPEQRDFILLQLLEPEPALTSNFDRGLFHIVTKENSPEKLASLGLEGRAPSDRTCGSRAF
ncbi:hypothetical protein PAL_GLEAN10010773 [Pteropus alecto]|uniref:Uncharacterized protein n=1 Tax=Pteropus alecto TaxID=9402 RepID=L5KWG4_PTEAL|nr:hypothetical protein PAL_GLEAN10010773 [Pteropus alecto]